MTVTRRDFLKLSAATALSGTSVRHLAFADESAAGDVLIIVFLRGGCDGLSLLAPVNDPNYVADRAPELRVQDTGARPGRSLRHELVRALDFRLHPEAAMLGDLYDAGHLAFIHAAGLTNGTRSHFVAQDLMERGLADAAMLKEAPDGWLTRVATGRSATAPAVATTPSIPAALAFHARSLAVPDLRGGLGLPGGAQAQTVLASLYANASDPFARAAQATLADMGMIDSRLPRGSDGKVLAYQPEGNAVYEETETGRSFQTLARLLKMDLGLSLACIDVNGWDHHENMAGRFSNLAGQFGRGLAAFWNDTVRYHDRMTLVVMTEFGRRLRTNKSNGTDHGHGGVMMVLGGHIKGGAIYGRWPGLESDELDNGVDLAVTTDYRVVLAEILTTRLGAAPALSRIFPHYDSTRRLGLATA